MNQPMTILITDDDPTMVSLTSTVLRRAGYEVFEASTGRECLEALRKHRPDLILLDVVLPDISGVDLCRQIKTEACLRETFIILFSGVHKSSEYQAEGLNVGADGYIIKPISNKELVARVHAMERIKDAEYALKKNKKEQQELISKLKAAIRQVRTLSRY